MGDGISIQSIVGKSMEVSQAQQSQGARPDADQEFAKHLRAGREPEGQLLREVREAKDARIQEQRERRRREREAKRERARRKSPQKASSSGRHVDIKV